MAVQPQPAPEAPEAPWPPPWAKTAAFFVGLGLMIYEVVVDKSAHYVAYGPAFALTGLPVVRGVEVLLDKLSTAMGRDSLPPPSPPPPPALPPPPADVES